MSFMANLKIGGNAAKKYFVVVPASSINKDDKDTHPALSLLYNQMNQQM